MATLVRVTGIVTDVAAPRSGTAKQSGNPWASTDVTVLLAGQSAVTFSYDHTALQSSGALLRFVPFEVVDLWVEVGVYRDEPSLRYAGTWDEAKSEAIILALASAAPEHAAA